MSKRGAPEDASQLGASSAKMAAIDNNPSPSSSSSMDQSDANAPPSTKGEGRAGVANAGGILLAIARSITGPIPMHPMIMVRVDSAHMVGFFNQMFDSIVNAIYPDSRDAMGAMITRDHFTLVCRYLTKARVDHVYGSTSGRRPPHRIAIPRAMAVPKALADVLNGIGDFVIPMGAFRATPQPEDSPADQAQHLQNRITYAILAQFTALCEAARNRGIIRLSEVSTHVEGTAWWLISPRDAHDPNNVADDSEDVIIRSAFRDFTPSDAIIAALVQRRFDGVLPDVAPAFWTTEFIRGIPSLRESFNLKA